jgi:hypothetical protein
MPPRQNTWLQKKTNKKLDDMQATPMLMHGGGARLPLEHEHQLGAVEHRVEENGV